MLQTKQKRISRKCISHLYVTPTTHNDNQVPFFTFKLSDETDHEVYKGKSGKAANRKKLEIDNYVKVSSLFNLLMLISLGLDSFHLIREN